MILRDEGREPRAYKDSLGYWTIGVGHLLPPGDHDGLVWTDEQIDAALEADIEDARQDCKSRLPWFDDLDEVRQAVLIAMCFQLGIKRMLGFAHMLMYVKQGYWAGAAKEMENSIWAHQTPKRCIRMADQMLTGKWT